MSTGEETDREDRGAERGRLEPPEAGHDGAVQGGDETRGLRKEVVGNLGESGVGTKREDCEALLGGVGLISNLFQLYF